MGENGGWSLEAPSEGPNRARTLEIPLFGVLYVGKNMNLGRMSEETRFPYMVYAAAALAGDDSPGRQCTEMMTHVFVCQACACGVPNVVKNVRQNGMDSHR